MHSIGLEIPLTLLRQETETVSLSWSETFLFHKCNAFARFFFSICVWFSHHTNIQIHCSTVGSFVSSSPEVSHSNDNGHPRTPSTGHSAVRPTPNEELILDVVRKKAVLCRTSCAITLHLLTTMHAHPTNQTCTCSPTPLPCKHRDTRTHVWIRNRWSNANTWQHYCATAQHTQYSC